MRYFVNAVFEQYLKYYDLSEDLLKPVIADIQKHRAISLGQHLYKIRVSAKGQGKRGGFRVIFFWKRENCIIFCHVFAKSDVENLDYKKLKALYDLSVIYQLLTHKDIEDMVNNQKLKEIVDD